MQTSASGSCRQRDGTVGRSWQTPHEGSDRRLSFWQKTSRVELENEDIDQRTALATALLVTLRLFTQGGASYSSTAGSNRDVVAQDIPVVREGVATLEGFITANINAQVQGYLSRTITRKAA